ncbi:helix-turn-helix domain-containing protein [Corynebacterium tapiri]|uniref:DNA binding HTH domain-containing protein n=1 Tax=Corynebacterium tapiri TaxID=1448266 RepID=A0A5C4U6F3_9CORY|nr:helix-turn-helix domain-containing protein [Corynebacterium tapiri]TNL99337.1 hypothetical protein FHE74_02985 [Corynebacterium tapiri]
MSGLPEPILTSWQRSQRQGVDADTVARAATSTLLDDRLQRAGERVLSQWATSLEDFRLSILVADNTGMIIARHIVDARDRSALERVNAAEGFDFSESSVGTNGLGTPLHTGEDIFVQGSHHFSSSLAQLACAGVPITHPNDGRIVGSIALAAHIEHSAPLMLGMARHAGQQITEVLRSVQAAAGTPGSLRLSRFEHSERATILAALQEHQGNKLQAAVDLGIGRTTLYRKMRALKIDETEIGTAGNSAPSGSE